MTLDRLLACAADYVAAFEAAFSSVVAEERLEQTGRVTDAAGFTYVKRRITRADMLLVKDPAGDGWMPFRDVFEVDGTSVREREERLRQLFLEQPSTAVGRAQEIARESARYNIGGIGRTINVPTLPLLFLSSTHASRFSFRKAGEETLAGIRAWKIAFSERARPTFITSFRGDNMPASGAFWIDPRTGSVVRSQVEVFEVAVRMTALVTYTADAVEGLWVPAEMREQYRRPDGGYVNTVAAYSNFRRFQVTTTERIKAP